MGRLNLKPTFNKQFKVQKGAGPVYNYNRPLPNQKSTNKDQFVKKFVLCEGDIDNLVKYVWEFGTTGDHLGYVDCDYVE
jgi:hypothetical protein